MKKLFVVGLSAMMALTLVAGCGGDKKADDKKAAKPADKKIVLKLSHVFSPDEQLYKSMELVAGRIKEKTQGRVEIQCFGQGQLATYKDGLEQVAQGANFISVEDPSYLGDYVPEFKVFAGPMMFQSFEEYEVLCNSDMLAKMKADAEKKNITVLALDYVFGFRNVMTNKVVKTPADLKGMKLRTPKSKVYVDTINYMGATATALPWSETLPAVSQKVVDGLEGSEFTNIGTKCYEHVKNVAFTRHLLGTCGVYINTNVLKSIPEADRKIVIEEFKKGGPEMLKISSDSYNKVKAELEAKGVKFNEVDHAQFDKAILPIYEAMESKEGVKPGTYKAMKAELEKIRANLKK